mgnify:CR=1 FL=1
MKIGYGRVSTKHQERYGTSLAEQKKELTEAGAEVVTAMPTLARQCIVLSLIS